MFAFIKKLFGTKKTEVAPVPYKVETPVVEAKKPAAKKAKKATVAAKTARKPRAKKAE